MNGKSLGKFWSIGPQQTLYLPSCWVRKGRNEIVVFEMDDRNSRTIAGLPSPVLDRLQKDPNAGIKSKAREGKMPILDAGDKVFEGRLKAGNEPQIVKFPQPVSARHICLETLSSHGGTPFVHAAELEILDEEGKPLPRKGWKIWFADSEETASENGRAENLIDGKPETFWHSNWSGTIPQHPHVVVVDMGEIRTVSGIEYQGRPSKFPGGIDALRIYARPQFFLPR